MLINPRRVLAVLISTAWACARPALVDTQTDNVDTDVGHNCYPCSEITSRVGAACEAHEPPCVEYICYSSMNLSPECELGFPTLWAPLSTLEAVQEDCCRGIRVSVLAECDYFDYELQVYREIWSLNCNNVDL